MRTKCSAMEKKEKGITKVVNTAIGLVCVIALMLICSEPAEGTSFNDWFLWEIFWMAVVVICAIYLNKHLPDDNDRA